MSEPDVQLNLQDPPPEAPGTHPRPPGKPRRRTLWYWIGGVVAVLIIAGVAASYLRNSPAPAPGPGEEADAGKDMPPSLRPYYEKAKAGDVNAMRMLGTLYYNGLNVPQNTREGIRWYRKAAKAGSVAAKKDLEQLGLTPEE